MTTPIVSGDRDENLDKASITTRSVSSKVRSNRRLRWIAVRCTVGAVLTLYALGSFAKGRDAARPEPEPTLVKGELSDLRIPLGTDQRVCVDTIWSNEARGVDCSELNWRLTNPDPSHPVASIDAKGMVSGLSVGKATLTVTYLGRPLSAVCTVTKPVVKKFQIQSNYPTIDEGSKESFQAAAEFESEGFKDVVRGVRWSVAEVAPTTQVAVIDQTGQATGLHAGMAEIRATWMGHAASTMLNVVPPSKDSPNPVRISGLRPKAWRRLCTARLRRIWLPRLRALPDAKVELTSIGDRSFGLITVAVKQAALEREITIRWNPDECDAGGPTRGWVPTGFDGNSPAIPVEHVLAAAGYDCLDYLP